MRHIFLILLAACICQYTQACGPSDRAYSPEEYYTFRICGDNMSGLGLQKDLKPDIQKQMQENCLYWAKTTSMRIPLQHIKTVVYNWNYKQLKQLHDCASSGHAMPGNNAFANWLVRHKDTEATSYLLLAKKCEITRSRQASEWYYPVDGDDESVVLTEILEQAGKYQSPRLLDRYSLQMLRCLIAMRKYDECLNVWMERQHVFHEKVISDMAKGYAAGAFFHLGEAEKAKKMFVEVGDIYSYLFCLQKEKKTLNARDLLSFLCQNDINGERVLPLLQNVIHSIEKEESEWSWGYKHDDYLKLYYSRLNDLATQAIFKADSKNLAAWHYAASYTYDKLGKKELALKHIRQASKHGCNRDLKDAIHVFQIYLTVKYAPEYDSDLENYLYNELIWLHGKTCSSVDSTTFVSVISLRDKFSQHYWNDMMRKIVISQVVPKCIASGYKVRALQFLNYADYSILNILGYDEDWRKAYIIEFEEKKDTFYYDSNEYDYRTDFFINLDSMGVKYVKRLAHRMKKPLCPLDRFLCEYSYNDMNYLYEIIGTQLIAAMRYKEAVQYLALVPDNFNQTRNIYEPLEFDAFCNLEYNTVGSNRAKSQSGKSYKLDFARKMCALEQSIKNARNPNDKAEYMLEYARGLQNSIGYCWKLTSYYKGYWGCYPFYSRYQTNLHDNIAKHSEKIKEEAFQLFTDAERAAQALYKWNMCKAVVTRYPETKMAEYVRGHCDELANYQVPGES